MAEGGGEGEEMQPDAEVFLELGLDDESDKALRVAWSVAERLVERGIVVLVTPSHGWLSDPVALEASDLPKVYVNGKLMFIGRAPSEAELEAAIESRLGLRQAAKAGGVLLESREEDDGFWEVALALA